MMGIAADFFAGGLGEMHYAVDNHFLAYHPDVDHGGLQVDLRGVLLKQG
jgi:hypothetical protein